MAKNIIQKIVFKNTTPKQLYNLYVDSKKHSAVTGAKAKMSTKSGADFSIYDGYSWGKNIQLVKDFLIVQTWRASDWSKDAPDSILMLTFRPVGKNTEVLMVHYGVPDKSVKELEGGWHEFYWMSWKKYLSRKK